MRYVQLRAFHYVAICGGFSRAAETLFLTQPAISDQVRKLEEEYDVLLFNRHKKQVTPTVAGQQLLEITRRMFDTEQQALELLSESRALRSGTLRIVADAAHHLLHILGQFRQKYPGIQVSVRAGNTETVISSLYSYEADIGVLGEIPTGRDFEVVNLNSTPIVAFVSTDHPLASAKSLSLHELSLLPLVMRERGSKTRAKLEDLAAKEGFEFKPAIEAEGREAVREIVASGAGVGFVSSAEFGQDARLVRIPIAAPEMLMDEALICLKERSGGKLVRVFLDIARSMAAAG
ncbi:LysR family transcriptional regulator [Aminobacter anthyllidis]|jgi:aminoethylphosphonate catabolism LysR family transcriptional regulator|uniref:LysR family transcriptional regulator n=1 Tax=Aminobacter anthyllidis TaxID=1035067 RepID=A0A9X1ACP1_9HYPH|nr:LysR substrate-binding domain-containing protein [Aminobacter anthyllidis]MBT1157087.1 LysR family transcriptional regulator [Aminobacter anthyllidis]